MSVTFLPGKMTAHWKYGEIATFIDVPEGVNVTNTNARMLLRLVGIDQDELMGRLTFSQVRKMAELADDLSLQKPSREWRGDRGAKVIEIGVSLDRLRGYADRLEKLVDVAEQIDAEFITYG